MGSSQPSNVFYLDRLDLVPTLIVSQHDNLEGDGVLDEAHGWSDDGQVRARGYLQMLTSTEALQNDLT